MSDIFDEVQDDLRREQMERTWKKAAPYVFGAAVVIVALVAGWRGWEWYENKRAVEASDRYAAAIAQAEAGQVDAAIASLEQISGDGPDGYAMLARFSAAALRAKQDAAQGAETYQSLAGENGLNASLTGLARLQEGLLQAGRVDYVQLSGILEPLTDANSPWRHTARETLAFAAYQAGQVEEARRWSNAALADPALPGNIRTRVERIGQLLAEPAPLEAPAPASAQGSDPADSTSSAPQDAQPQTEGAPSAPGAEQPQP